MKVFSTPAARRLLWLACLCLSAPASADWDALRALQARRGATVTALAVDLDSGRRLEALAPDQRLTPASLSKIVLAAAALDAWPADKVFATRVLGTGSLDKGRLSGDLIVTSEGDPSFDHQSLWFLASQVRQAGVREVAGDLLVAGGPFGTLPCETKDRCEASVRTHSAYDALPSSFGVDYGSWCLDIRGGLPGEPASLRSCAGVDLPIPVNGRINTAAPLSGGLWLDRVSLPDGDTLSVGGSIEPGVTQRLYRSMGDPARGAALLLREVLAALDVQMTGEVRLRNEPPPPDARLLAEYQGLPLREQVQRLLRYSNNYITDVLVMDMAAERTPEPVATLASASRPLSDLVFRALTGWTQATVSPPPMFSGSGLTPENRLSAEDLVAVLAQQYRNTETFPVFYAGLVVPGQAPHGYLRHGDEAWKTRVAIKTGTLSEPYSVFGVAGYLRKQNGGWIAFAALSNAAPRKPVPMRETLAAIRRDVSRLAERY